MNDFVSAAVMIAGLVQVLGFVIVCATVSVRELYAHAIGFDTLKLAYVMSKEDRESLSKEDLQAAHRMSHEELKAFVAEGFPNTVPEIHIPASS